MAAHRVLEGYLRATSWCANRERGWGGEREREQESAREPVQRPGPGEGF